MCPLSTLNFEVGVRQIRLPWAPSLVCWLLDAEPFTEHAITAIPASVHALGANALRNSARRVRWGGYGRRPWPKAGRRFARVQSGWRPGRSVSDHQLQRNGLHFRRDRLSDFQSVRPRSAPDPRGVHAETRGLLARLSRPGYHRRSNSKAPQRL